MCISNCMAHQIREDTQAWHCLGAAQWGSSGWGGLVAFTHTACELKTLKTITPLKYGAKSPDNT